MWIGLLKYGKLIFDHWSYETHLFLCGVSALEPKILFVTLSVVKQIELTVLAFNHVLLSTITPYAQRERGKVIVRGVHNIYIIM